MTTPTTFRYSEDAGIATLAERDEVKVIIITGEGRGFCSGGDVEAIIGELLKQDMTQLLAFTRMTGALIRNIRAVPKPVIAAINGIAAGAGAVIALASDLRIAVPSARLAFLFTRVGLAGADMGAAYLLPRVVGLARATELLMLGDNVAADRALAIGLINKISEPEALIADARELATRLAAGPTFAIGMTKTLLNQELDLDFVS